MFKKLSNYLGTKGGSICKFIGFIIIYQLGQIPLLILSPHQGTLKQFEIIISGLILNGFILGYIIWRYNKQIRAANPFHFGKRPVNKKRIGVLILLMLAMLVIQYLWSTLIDLKVLPVPDNQKALDKSMQQMFLVNYLYAGLIAPVFEEYIFRGIFFNYFFKLAKGKTTQVIGVIVCGLVFGFVHTQAFDLNWLFYSALGWVLSTAYVYFKDIKYDIAIHMFNNLI